MKNIFIFSFINVTKCEFKFTAKLSKLRKNISVMTQNLTNWIIKHAVSFVNL